MTADKKKKSGDREAKKPRVKKDTVKDLEPGRKGDEVKGGQRYLRTVRACIG